MSASKLGISRNFILKVRHLIVVSKTEDSRANVYLLGWQRKIGYCIAFSADGATDVTPRYVRNFAKWGAGRVRAPEAVLIWILDEIRATRRKTLSKREKFDHQGEDNAERKELQGYIAEALADELCKSLLNGSTSLDPSSRKVVEIEQEAGG